MQTGKNAMGSAKETAESIAATAKAGLDKTKATVDEKVEKLRSQDPAEKAAAEQRAGQRRQEAEVNKQVSKEESAAEREQRRASGGVAGQPIGQAGQHPTA